ncbi:hypothetical protein D9M72_319320 [compost metagenome]
MPHDAAVRPVGHEVFEQLQQLVALAGARLERRLAGFHAVGGEVLVDQRGHALRGGAQVQAARQGLLARGVEVLGDLLRGGVDDGQRRAELVRHHRDEIHLRLLGAALGLQRRAQVDLEALALLDLAAQVGRALAHLVFQPVVLAPDHVHQARLRGFLLAAQLVVAAVQPHAHEQQVQQRAHGGRVVGPGAGRQPALVAQEAHHHARVVDAEDDEKSPRLALVARQQPQRGADQVDDAQHRRPLHRLHGQAVGAGQHQRHRDGTHEAHHAHRHAGEARPLHVGAQLHAGEADADGHAGADRQAQQQVGQPRGHGQQLLRQPGRQELDQQRVRHVDQVPGAQALARHLPEQRVKGEQHQAETEAQAVEKVLAPRGARVDLGRGEADGGRHGVARLQAQQQRRGFGALQRERQLHVARVDGPVLAADVLARVHGQLPAAGVVPAVQPHVVEQRVPELRQPPLLRRVGRALHLELDPHGVAREARIHGPRQGLPTRRGGGFVGAEAAFGVAQHR